MTGFGLFEEEKKYFRDHLLKKRSYTTTPSDSVQRTGPNRKRITADLKTADLHLHDKTSSAPEFTWKVSTLPDFFLSDIMSYVKRSIHNGFLKG